MPPALTEGELHDAVVTLIQTAKSLVPIEGQSFSLFRFAGSLPGLLSAAKKLSDPLRMGDDETEAEQLLELERLINATYRAVDDIDGLSFTEGTWDEELVEKFAPTLARRIIAKLKD